ncbi:hypothetical protein ACFQDG_01945 [Natronoarchaeum mannanilyticum]|uniref:Uncharacterized protein n=1 Tax=Natronoarchaeum mannanilyticum TaxID=926360 RepID=A0AAV3TBJ4_9EURY
MNRHFSDARYYLTRAGAHAKKGVVETLEPVVAKGRELAGREAEPEPGRVERLRAKLDDASDRAENEAADFAADARRRVRRYRGT